MVKINLTGEAKSMDTAVKVLLDEDMYTGTVTKISDIITVPAYSGDGEAEKIVIGITVDNLEAEGKPVELAMWLNTSITKGSTRNGKVYNNSKLYDLLDKAGALQELSQIVTILETKGLEEQNTMLIDFIKTSVINRKVKFLTKNRNGKDGQAYSGVDKVLSFTDATVESEPAPAEAPAPEAAPAPAEPAPEAAPAPLPQ